MPDIREERRKAAVDAARRIKISLHEPSSSGYQWRFKKKDDKLKVVSNRLKANLKSFGGSSKRHFTLKVLRDHPKVAVFELSRPWNKEVVERQIYDLEFPSES